MLGSMHRLLISNELFKIRSIKVYLYHLFRNFSIKKWGEFSFHADSSAQFCVKPDDCVLQQDLRMICLLNLEIMQHIVKDILFHVNISFPQI